MKCTKCGLREATTEVLQRHNNHIEKLYLCDECAANFKPDFAFDDFDMIANLINGSPMGLLSNMGFGDGKVKTLICPDCKTTSEEFLKTGFVGCPRCYDVFAPLILQTVRQLQQADKHVGKVPAGDAYIVSELDNLKAELQTALKNDDFDRINELMVKINRFNSGEDRKGGK